MVSSKVKEEVKFLLYISPWIIGFLTFTVGPLYISFYYSFFDYNAITEPIFVGLDNYISLLHDTIYKKSLWNTMYFVFFGIPFILMFQIAIAALLNIELKGIRLFRTFYYLPYLVPLVATVILWRIMFSKDAGVVNLIVTFFGGERIEWINSELFVRPLIITISMWMSGGAVLIFLAALKGIPRHLYESAQIDGAGKIRSFFSVTLPMLTPAILFSLVMQIIYYFQMFTEALLLNNGQPNYASMTYMLNTYNTAFRDFEFGYAMSQSWILFLIILLVTLVVLTTSKRWVYYESEKGN